MSSMVAPVRAYPGLLLLPQHEALLSASGIAPTVAVTRGYKSVDTKAALGRFGFKPVQRSAPALLLPVWSALTKRVAFYQARPDEPRIGTNGKSIKYETPHGVAMALDAHPVIQDALGDPTQPLWITEGIRKADAAISRGLCCVALMGVWNWRGTNSAGGKTALPDWESIALNDRTAYIGFDSDAMLKPEVHAALERLARFLAARDAHVLFVYLPQDGPGKVGLDDYLASGHTVAELTALATTELRRLDCVPPSATAVTVDLRRRAAPVLEATDPLMMIRNAIRDQGYGGDIRPALLVHLALTTRVLKMRPGTIPAHLLLVGQPSVGKNYTLQINLRLLPPEAYHTIDAGSPRTLIYDDADLRHRVVVFSEADSLPAGEDNPAASAIRNLLQDHHLHYSVTVRDPETGDFTVREVDKPGPTTLVTTSTRRLGPQLESRLFAVDIPDDQAQIQEALATQAAIELTGVRDPDSAVIACQELLQAQAPWEVVVPFVEPLSKALGRIPSAARVLRDFGKLTALIKAVTVLRHLHRARDAQGRVIADIDDYRSVYELVREVYVVSTSGANKGVRQVVAAVEALRAEGVTPITKRAVAHRVELSEVTAWRHIKTALSQRWLTNKEERKNRPAVLDLGDPLPEDAGLPAPEDVGVDLPVRGENVKTPPEMASFQPSRSFLGSENGAENTQTRQRGPSETRVFSFHGKPEDTLAQRPTAPLEGPDDDGRRVWLRAMGRILGWSHLPLGGAESIAAGEQAWHRFIAAPANTELVDRTVTVLLAIDADGARKRPDADDKQRDVVGAQADSGEEARE